MLRLHGRGCPSGIETGAGFPYAKASCIGYMAGDVRQELKPIKPGATKEDKDGYMAGDVRQELKPMSITIVIYRDPATWPGMSVRN